ncbi:MAG: hypothetical protein WC770_04975 [Phycisphaerae bacterium]|jgi:hypothetical protein
MKRNNLLKILNPIMLVFFFNQAITAIFRDSLSLKTFGIFHKTGGAILLCLIALHFILNFNWVKANYFSK